MPTSFELRPLPRARYAEAAAIHAAASRPPVPVGEAELARRDARRPGGVRRLGAFFGEELLAHGRVSRASHENDEGLIEIDVQVAPKHQGQGCGTALFGALDEMAGDAPRRTVLMRADDARARRFLARRGFSCFDRYVYSGVSFDSPLETPPLPMGYTLRSLSCLREKEGECCTHERIFAYLREVYASMPGGDRWLEGMSIEDLARRLSDEAVIPEEYLFAVTPAGVLAARTDLRRTSDVSVRWTGFTGTHPEHRGRGLATRLKRIVMSVAHEHGVRRVVTANSEGNTPMRGINARLGYEVICTLEEQRSGSKRNT